MRVLGTSVAVAASIYVAAGAGLWSFQRHLVFQPEREMHAAAADFPFAIVDTSVPVRSDRLHGWWIPASGGETRTVLYLHGNDGNVSTSIGEIAPLRALGFAVLLIDYRGFGRSEGAFPSERSVYEDAEAAWNYLLREKSVRPDQLYLYGHSLGGAVAIELATRHPEAAGLIVESSFTSIYDMARLEKQYRAFPLKLFLNQRFDSISKVERLKLPVLFIHGTADEVVPFAMSERLYARAAGRKQFLAIPGGRHDNNAAAGGVIFSTGLRRFLETEQAAQRGLNSSSM